MENTHLVVGANGFLGSHVVRQLLEAGNTVRAGVRAGSVDAHRFA